jgi:hypothetical protein
MEVTTRMPYPGLNASCSNLITLSLIKISIINHLKRSFKPALNIFKAYTIIYL